MEAIIIGLLAAILPGFALANEKRALDENGTGKGSEKLDEEKDDPGEVAQNLASDLGPLLSLFGEKFASQFMSQAMSWLDCIVFSLGPLGIITAITNAIRVCGPPWLKALIGRARETLATAEMESMSSTSEEVGECWNGRSIVRVIGNPKIMEILHNEAWFEQEEKKQAEVLEKYWGLNNKFYGQYWIPLAVAKRNSLPLPASRTYGIFTIDEARRLIEDKAPHVIHCTRPHIASRRQKDKSRFNFIEESFTSIQSSSVRKVTGFIRHRHYPKADEENGTQSVINTTHSPLNRFKPRTFNHHLRNPDKKSRAPNLSLNISQDKYRSVLELYLAVCFGAVAQTAVVGIAAALSYNASWNKEGFLGAATVSKDWAFPLYIAGTLGLSAGLYLCTIVVENSSQELVWFFKGEGQEKTKNRLQCLWLQKHSWVNEQSFDSFAIVGQGQRKAIFTSERWLEIDSTVAPTGHQHRQRILELLAKKRSLKAQTVIGAFLTVCGFILQFLGIRGSHYLVAILTIALTVVMSTVRAFLRRGLSFPPASDRISQEHELDWFATRFNSATSETQIWSPSATEPNHVLHRPRLEMNQVIFRTKLHITNPWDESVFLSLAGTAQRVIDVRKRLKSLSGWETEEASSSARAVSLAISEVMEVLVKNDLLGGIARKKFRWNVPVMWNKKEETIYLTVERDAISDIWKADEDSIESIISLSTWKPEEEPTGNSKGSDKTTVDHFCSQQEMHTYVQVIDNYTEGLEQCINWWTHNKVAIAKEEIAEKEFCQSSVKPEGYKDPIPLQGYRLGSMSTEKPSPNLADSAAVGRAGEAGYFLTARSTTDPFTAISRHIFTSFMWAIADHCDMIVSNSPLANEARDHDLDMKDTKILAPRYTMLVERLSRDLQLGTPEEIALCILPPLYASGKLSDADYVISKAMVRAGGYNAHSNWDVAAHTYIDVFEAALKYGSQTELGIKATVLLVEFFFFLNRADKMAHCDSERINRLREEVTKHIRRADKSVLFELVRINQKLHIDTTDLAAIAEDARMGPRPTSGSNNCFGRNTHHLAALTGDLDRVLSSAVKGPSSSSEQKEDKPREDAYRPISERDYFFRSPLHYAILFCSISKDDGIPPGLDELIRMDHDLNRQDHLGCTAVHYACHRKEGELLVSHLGNQEVVDKYGRTPVHHAAEVGDCKLVDSLISTGRGKHDRDIFGLYPIHTAASVGRPDKILELLFIGNNQMNDKNGRSPISLAVRGGHFPSAYYLLKISGKSNSQDDDTTDLHSAAEAGNAEFTKALIDYLKAVRPEEFESLFHKRNRCGRTPGLLACWSGSAKLVPVLFRKESLAETDVNGWNAVHLAATSNSPDAITEVLQYEDDNGSAGTLIQKYDHSGRLPVDLAAWFGCLRTLDKLLELQKDSDDVNPLSSALMWACKAGKMESVDFLVRRGANIESLDEKGRTPLYCAAEEGQIECMQELLDVYDAKPNITANNGIPLLFRAFDLYMQYPKVLQILCGRGNIDLQVTDPQRKTILFKAVEINLELLTAILNGTFFGEGVHYSPDMMHRNNSDQNLLDYSLHLGRLDTFNAIRDRCRDLITDDEGRHRSQELLVAVIERETDRVKKLLSGGAHPDPTLTTGENNHTALHRATANGDSEIVKCLLDNPGPDADTFFNKQTRLGETAIHLACSMRLPEILEMLLKRPYYAPDSHPQTNEGNTELHELATADQSKGVKVLIRMLADKRPALVRMARTKNNLGYTAVRIALLKNHQKLARLLIEKLDPDLNATDMYGMSVLSQKARNGVVDESVVYLLNLPSATLQSLLSFGQDQYSGTPLDNAITSGAIDMSNRLVAARSPWDVPDIHGWTTQHKVYLSNLPHVRRSVIGIPINLLSLEQLSAAQSPTAWSQDFLPASIISLIEGHHNLRARYLGDVETFDPCDYTKFFGVQANHPFPAYGQRYYEVKIIEAAAEDNVSIGLCVGLEWPINGMVGWRKTAWGLHGDDGNFFHGSSSSSQATGAEGKRSIPVKYGQHDIMGCGLDKHGNLFFAKNGAKIPGRYPQLIGQLFPICRFAVGGVIEANFGHDVRRPFRYQLQDEDISTLKDFQLQYQRLRVGDGASQGGLHLNIPHGTSRPNSFVSDRG